jgi:RNA polymerase sporulation-specific sigma factor
MDLMRRPDEELIQLFWEGNQTAFEVLLHRYTPLIVKSIQGYYIQGSSWDDRWQEARLGFYKAVRDWKPDRNSSFPPFARLCVIRQVQTAVKMARAWKHQAINHYEMLDSLTEATHPTYEIDLAEENFDWVQRAFALLSAKELEIFSLRLDGHRYDSITKITGYSRRTIDNALMRARAKMRKVLLDEAPHPDDH